MREFSALLLIYLECQKKTLSITRTRYLISSPTIICAAFSRLRWSLLKYTGALLVDQQQTWPLPLMLLFDCSLMLNCLLINLALIVEKKKAPHLLAITPSPGHVPLHEYVLSMGHTLPFSDHTQRPGVSWNISFLLTFWIIVLLQDSWNTARLNCGALYCGFSLGDTMGDDNFCS